MSNHPLQYFKDLILRNKIANEKLKFMMSTDLGPVIKRDFQNGTIEYAVIVKLLFTGN